MILKPLAVGILSAAFLSTVSCFAQAPQKYHPTLESLDRHPLPQWYDGAKLGIFIHWGLYSVPGWAPINHPDHDFSSADYIRYNPYAEWYLNVLRVPGSPTAEYHKQHYGEQGYYDFAPTFNRESKKWNPDKMAAIFRDAGARYVVLTSKHHEGFTLWPSTTPNPTPSLKPSQLHAERDIVGELTTAVQNQGLKMGLYYSGGYDWTFNTGPIETDKDYDAVKPQSEAYGKYAFAQIHELIDRYHPAVLWNDIDWPKTGNALQVEADYYNAIPDGVIDDRFGIKHSDFTSPEYEKKDQISEKKWEECRGLGRSFGYNRAEGEKETIAPGELIALLVDIVSKNGNLLLDVGPEADGTIPPVQMERLKALGEWLKQNGEAIYDTTPWTKATGKSAEGDDLRFTKKGNDLYVTVLGKPKAQTITITDLPAKNGIAITQVGDNSDLGAKDQANGMRIALRGTPKGDYAYAFKLADYAR
ncbi:alpha-L-fucosidase [Telmatobacter sp. DSM 110680]|uniref:alpha-L-fucosidase n=1 Tax=Telmatobacter sp. DSM 110680 TaxID=3036704 RepID=A0AAU7DET6_9BACT